MCGQCVPDDLACVRIFLWALFAGGIRASSMPAGAESHVFGCGKGLVTSMVTVCGRSNPVDAPACLEGGFRDLFEEMLKEGLDRTGQGLQGSRDPIKR